MATTASRRVLVMYLLVIAGCVVLGSSDSAEAGQSHGGCFTRLFSFGDSVTDNGNWMRYARSPGAVARLPYGETFFHRPNGRFCDGRIIIDHIADALGIPFLTPYLAGNTSDDYAHGANFAVGGATALGHDYFRKKKLDVRFTPYSLGWQMSWLKKVIDMTSSKTKQGGPRPSELMASSLFLVGEIGGNDYNQALFQGRSVDEVRTYVPDVVAGISASLVIRSKFQAQENQTTNSSFIRIVNRSMISTCIRHVQELIELGARTVVVPGNFPIGCNPGYLTRFPTNDTAQYDAMGCLKWPNDLTELHNRALKAELDKLGQRHPGVTIVYADYFAAAMDLIADPAKHGFGGEPLVSCCGGGGPYNANLTVHCGMKTATTCRDPYKAVSWDGFHFTDHAYKVIIDGVLRGPYAAPPVLTKCKSRRKSACPHRGTHHRDTTYIVT